MPAVRSFNPRPHTGGDDSRTATAGWGSCFNPRPHTGGDPSAVPECCTPRCFNPRPHTGGDNFGAAILAALLVSIHAPTRGATFCLCFDNLNKLSFNPRPHTGGDPNNSETVTKQFGFNPRPHTGGDSMYYNIFTNRRIWLNIRELYLPLISTVATERLLVYKLFILRLCETT